MVEGMVATARAQVSVIYLFESLKKDHFAKVYSLMSSIEGVIGVMSAIYFIYISKSWLWILLVGYCLQVAGTIGVFFFPESPKYLIKTGQIDRALQVFQSIASTNKADPSVVTR